MPDFAGAVQLRVACPSDMDAIQRLCLECFPVRYPDVWYTELVSTTRYITVLAFICHTNQNQELEETIVGLIVAEYRNINSCKIADRTIIHPRIAGDSSIMYILSLGVSKEYRGYGIGSLLLSVIIDHAKRQNRRSNCSISVSENVNYEGADSSVRLYPHQAEFVCWLRQQRRPYLPCRVVYLHTECTNHVALRFYRRRGFILHHVVPRCYLIDGRVADGFCCVLHCNGGYPYRSLPDSQEWFYWLHRRVRSVHAATMVLIGRTALRLRAALSSLFAPFSRYRRTHELEIGRIPRWQYTSPSSPSPGTSTTPLLAH